MSTKILIEQVRSVDHVRLMNGKVLPAFEVEVRVEFDRGYHEQAREMLVHAYAAAMAELEEFDGDRPEPEVRDVQQGGGGDS